MDNHRATIVGYAPGTTDFTVVGDIKNPGPGANSNENAQNHLEKTLVQKYFKEIGRHLENAEELHLTGTGSIQEQFKHYLGDTAQFKNTVVADSTSIAMSDKQLVEYMQRQFHEQGR